MAKNKTVLLACGSFNPPTNMHLRMFEIVRDELRLRGETVSAGIISPVHDNYGKEDLESSSHRCAMLKLALKSSNWIHLSQWECKQNEWTPTLKVLQHHQEILNKSLKGDSDFSNDYINEADNELSEISGENVTVRLLCGADYIQSLTLSHIWPPEDVERILKNHGLAVITRVGIDPRKVIHDSDLLSKYKNNIVVVDEWIPNGISSTEIRKALRRGKSVRYVMSSNVEKYIVKHNLYCAVIKYQKSVKNNINRLLMTNSSLFSNSCNNSDISTSSNTLTLRKERKKGRKVREDGSRLPKVEIQFLKGGAVHIVGEKETHL